MFAPKVAKPQTKAAESSTSKLTIHRSTQTLRRSVGNQPTLRPLARLATSLTGIEPRDRNAQEAAMASPAAEAAAAGLSWDFSKIPLFPPDHDSAQNQQGRESAPPIVHAVLRLSGEPLEGGARAMFESRFARDFGHVRIHRDAGAARSAAAVGAAAYTVGDHVVFGSGRYDVASDQGQRLIAHELVHTMQQGSRAPDAGPLPVIGPAEPAEQEAERLAQVAMGQTLATGGALTPDPSMPASYPLLTLQSGNRGVARQAQHQQQPVPLEEAEANRIPPADRHGLEIAAAGEIALAFTAFSNATAAHAAAIKNEAKARAEMIAAVVDVATGFLAPVFANWVTGKLMSKATSAAFSEWTKKALAGLITQQDAFKAAFTGATKLANQIMKSNANALFGETEIDAFALALRNTFQRGAVTLLDRLTTLTDAELLAVWTAYDANNADESAYRQVLAGLFKRYQEQVEPIGTKVSPGPEGEPGASSGVYEVQLAMRKRLANLTVWTSGEINLWAWITPDMEPIARAKATALGLGISTIALKDVNVTLAEILNPPRPDLRRKDMLEIAIALSPAERQRAAADPDVVSIVETKSEVDGRVPNQYERHKTLFVLRGFSDHAIACIDELDSWFPSGPVVEGHLRAANAAERSRLTQDAWFIGRLRAELRGYFLEQVLFTLGLGPAPKPPPEPDYDYQIMGP